MKKEDLVPGGKGDNINPNKFDKAELKVGIKVEREHTDSDKAALEIAIDHLSENPHYYSELIKAGLVDEKDALDMAKKVGLTENINKYSLKDLNGAYQFDDLRGKSFFVKGDKIYKRGPHGAEYFIEIRRRDLTTEFKFDKNTLEKISYMKNNSELKNILKPKKQIKENKMKESELKKIIQEEIKIQLNEAGLESKAYKFIDMCDKLVSAYKRAKPGRRGEIVNIVIESGIIPSYKAISDVVEKLEK